VHTMERFIHSPVRTFDCRSAYSRQLIDFLMQLNTAVCQVLRAMVLSYKDCCSVHSRRLQ